MQPIISGSAPERIIRAVVVFLLTAGYSAWSLWDGYIAYPRANMAATWREKIGDESVAMLPVINRHLTPDVAAQLQTGDSIERVESLGLRPAIEHRDSVYYFGHGGYLQVLTRDGKILASNWVSGPKHTAADLVFQRAIGFILAIVAVVLLIHLIRVLTFRTRLDDAGLKIGNRALIPWEAIAGVRTDARHPGRFQIAYREGDVKKVAELDEYLVKDARSMAAAINQSASLGSDGIGS